MLNALVAGKKEVTVGVSVSFQQVASGLLTCWKRASGRLQIGFRPVGITSQVSVFCINGAYYVKTEPFCCIFMQEFYSVSTFSVILKNGDVG